MKFAMNSMILENLRMEPEHGPQENRQFLTTSPPPKKKNGHLSGSIFLVFFQGGSQGFLERTIPQATIALLEVDLEALIFSHGEDVKMWNAACVSFSQCNNKRVVRFNLSKPPMGEKRSESKNASKSLLKLKKA